MHPTVVFFELGYAFNIMGLLILIMHIRMKRHIEGISVYTQLIFAIAAFLKVFYMPFTILVDFWVCWVELLASVFLSGYLMYQLKTYNRLSFSKETNYFDWRIIIAVSAVLAAISTYEKSHPFEWSQYAIRFSIIAEAIGLLPQIRFMKIEKFVPKYFGWYLICVMLNRISRIGFWVYQIKDNFSSDSYYTLILADLVYIILTADFIYNFFKHKNNNVIPYS